VLFTDLVGSTQLSASLAPSEADNLRRAHFSALRRAIANAGGTEVKNLGDGLMAVFPAASAAVSSAVAMQQTVEADNRRNGSSLGLRVGISCGEATREAGDYFGEPVIEAARLCAICTSGQILVAGIVRSMAGRRNPHRFTGLGTRDLKGLPEPVTVWEVDWDPPVDVLDVTERVPLPRMLQHRPPVGVIGRDEPLATLADAVKRVVTGGGREVVFLAGEPGQGKTTLVSEHARRSYGAGMTVLFGRCDEDVGSPYRPMHEALNHLVAHADEELLKAHVAKHGGALAGMVPALRHRLENVPPPQTTDPDTERYLLFAAVVGLLERAGADRPVMLILDDLHWADKPSLHLLRHVVSNTSSARLLIHGVYRDDELSSAHPLTEALAALHREPTGISKIDLKGLDDSGVIAFMEAAAGHELDLEGVALAHELYHETDGNPFFVYEVLRHLSESGAIVQDQTGHWGIAEAGSRLTLPHSVRSVIGTRVSRMGDEAAKVLSTASVIGRDFDLNLLAETTGSDEDDLIDLLEAAQHAALVREVAGSPGRYIFFHALIQHTLYQDMGATRRTRLHRQVGEALERICRDDGSERVGELARHFFLATQPTDVEKAVAYAQKAGEAALVALAPDDAVRYFSQALDLATQGLGVELHQRVDLLIGLGTAQRQAGLPEFRATLLDAAGHARHACDTDRLVRAALANTRGWAGSGAIDAERVDMLEASLQALPRGDSSERARLIATLCSELEGGPLKRRLAMAEEAKAMARRLGDPSTVVEVINLCSVPLRIPSTLQQHLDDSKEALAIARTLNDPVKHFRAATLCGIDATRDGQFALADRCQLIMNELSTRLQEPALQWQTALHEAALAMSHGEPAKAEQLASTALEIGTTSSQPDAFIIYGSQLMVIRFQQGRLSELVSPIADVARQNPSLPTFQAALAVVHMEAGEQAEARRLVELAAGNGFMLPMDTTWLDGCLCYSQVAIELGLYDAAEQLLELLLPYRAQVPRTGLITREPVAMFVGGLASVLGRFDQAEENFEHATELNAHGDMRFAETYTQLLWGRMLLARRQPSDVEQARGMLAQARSRAAARGYPALERRVKADLSQLI
jgi:tetratricopeptide (TPR) repeat protein